jgi:amino acid transporter
MTFTTARLIYVAGRERHLPAMFGELHPIRMTPVKALVLQGVLDSVMVIVGDFSGLVMLYGVVGWSWYFVRSHLCVR